VPRDFLKLVTRPADLLKALRNMAFGGVVAATGLSAPAAEAGEHTHAGSTPTRNPTIVDRSKKAAKLVLEIPGHGAGLTAQHRSHRSHSSHRSHYSSAGGTRGAPVVRPAPVPKTPAVAATTIPAAVNGIVGEIESIDTVKRVLVIKQTATVKKVFSYRDDTKFETLSGGTIRFDEFADSSGGRLPVVVGDRVQLKWRMSSDGKSQIASAVQKTR
jgi:hypothetical protein